MMTKWAVRDDCDREVDRFVLNFLLDPATADLDVGLDQSIGWLTYRLLLLSATAYGRKRETLVGVAGLQAILDSVDSMIESAVQVRNPITSSSARIVVAY